MRASVWICLALAWTCFAAWLVTDHFAFVILADACMLAGVYVVSYRPRRRRVYNMRGHLCVIEDAPWWARLRHWWTCGGGGGYGSIDVSGDRTSRCGFCGFAYTRPWPAPHDSPGAP